MDGQQKVYDMWHIPITIIPILHNMWFGMILFVTRPDRIQLVTQEYINNY